MPWKQFPGLIPEELASPEKSDFVFHSVNTPQGRCRNCDLRLGEEGPFLGEIKRGFAKREAVHGNRREFDNTLLPLKGLIAK